MPDPTNQRTRHGRSVAPARRFASIAAATDYADVSSKTIRRYIDDGRLTGYRIGPRLVKVDLADLDVLVQRIPRWDADP
jgi:excisionase family DNA binding protein